MEMALPQCGKGNQIITKSTFLGRYQLDCVANMTVGQRAAPCRRRIEQHRSLFVTRNGDTIGADSDTLGCAAEKLLLTIFVEVEELLQVGPFYSTCSWSLHDVEEKSKMR